VLEQRVTPSGLGAQVVPERFISRVYLDLLQRAPDAAGQSYFGSVLGQGPAGTLQVARAIAGSPEAHELTARSLYQRLLHREADPAGLDGLTALLAPGGTAKTAEAALLGSEEYFATRSGGTDAGFLTALYGDLLGRAPDDAGAALYGSLLQNGTPRSAVADLVLHSPEADQVLVRGIYRELLHREADPDGLNFWVGLLGQGVGEEVVRARFVASDEYAARLQADDLSAALRVPEQPGPLGPLSVTLTPDSAHAARALITPDGGTVQATGADGVTFTLTVPAGAVTDATTLTLTPVAAIPDLPLSGGLVAAVQFGPEGFQFFKPATLTVTVPGGLAANLIGFGFQGNGDDFHLAPVQVSGSTLTFTVTHFSGIGAGVSVPADIPAILERPASQATTLFVNQLVDLAQRHVSTSDPYLAIFRKWYDTAVRPKLSAAGGDDERLADALREYDLWKADIEDVPLAFGIPVVLGPPLAGRDQEAAGLTAADLRSAITRADQRCVAEQSLDRAEDALRWQGIVDALGLATAQNQLDLDTVLHNLPVEVLFENTDFPQAPSPGDRAILTVRAGVSLGGGPPVLMPLDVTVDAQSGIAPADAHTHATTDSQGVFADALLVGPDNAGDIAMTVTVRLAALDSGSRLSHVFQQAFIVRGGRTIQGDVSVTSAADLAKLSDVKEITGNLTVKGLDILDLKPLARLKSVGGDVYIESTSVADLTGLGSVTSAGRLILLDDLLLTHLTGLTSLTSIAGDLFIELCPQLADLTGLAAASVAIKGLVIVGTNASDLHGLGNVTGLEDLGIFNNKSMTSLAGLNSPTGLRSLSIIGNPVLTDLNALSLLTGGLPGGLEIEQNATLTSLAALGGISGAVGGLTIRGNDALPNLDGLSGITGVPTGVVIDGNKSLTSLAALRKITGTVSEIEIESNPALTKLDGLEGITRIATDVPNSVAPLRIENNKALTSLTGLNGLQGTVGEVGIFDNPSLENLKGLGGITAIENGPDGLLIEDNTFQDRTALNGLSSLKHVALVGNDGLFNPSVTIENNHGFTNDDAFNFLAHVSVSGGSRVVGNQA
jgi:hypothetical protein